MSRSIEINEIPDAVYDALKRRAEVGGVSLSELATQMLIEHTPAGRLELREWLEWLDTLEPLGVDVSASDIVEALHAGRAERL